MPRRDYDIAIAGAGPAGLTAALAIRHCLGPRLRISISDASLAAPRSTIRVYAISSGPKNMLSRLGAWQHLARPQPIMKMDITDSQLEDTVRQSFLQFVAEPDLNEPLAWIVEHDDIVAALRAALLDHELDFYPESIEHIEPGDTSIAYRLANSRSFSAGLLLACDGSTSRVRELLRIPVMGRQYNRSAIVATVEAECHHEAMAIQHFLPAGSFAMLPMTGGRFSLVWVEAPKDAKRFCGLPSAQFLEEVNTRAKSQFGAFRLVSGPEVFPLGLQIARNFAGPRAVLLADAAHTMHPLAGQGLNLGLSDVAHLMQVLTRQILLGLDLGTSTVLRNYEATRHFETARMLCATDALFHMFAGKSVALRHARDIGLGVINRLPMAKNSLIRAATAHQAPLMSAE